MASTSTPTTPQTLLEAVNELLQNIRISGVMSLDAADLKQDAADAKQALDNASRDIQKRGWEFNTEYDYVIDPNVTTGEITLPNNTLKVRIARTSDGNRLVQRGLRLYDNRKHTFAIGQSVTTELVLALPYEELNESFKTYVTAMAAIRFCKPKLPSGATFRYTDEFFETARREAEESDVAVEDGDLALTSPHFYKMRRR